MAFYHTATGSDEKQSKELEVLVNRSRTFCPRRACGLYLLCKHQIKVLFAGLIVCRDIKFKYKVLLANLALGGSTDGQTAGQAD